jgi:hypothetical protein
MVWGGGQEGAVRGRGQERAVVGGEQERGVGGGGQESAEDEGGGVVGGGNLHTWRDSKSGHFAKPVAVEILTNWCKRCGVGFESRHGLLTHLRCNPEHQRRQAGARGGRLAVEAPPEPLRQGS